MWKSMLTTGAEDLQLNYASIYLYLSLSIYIYKLSIFTVIHITMQGHP